MMKENDTPMSVVIQQSPDSRLLLEDSHNDEGLNWGNAKPPCKDELSWVKSFGRYLDFNPELGKLSERVSLEIANLKQATRIIGSGSFSMLNKER